ncbi:MAG: hypothetical protein HRF44_03975 [Ignavibacterium sp.]|jgi:hypothetical protein
MKLTNKILLLSVGTIFPILVAYSLVDHWEQKFATHLVNGIYILLGFVSFFIFLNEQTPRNKAVFFNFSLYFLSAFASLIYPFVGKAIFSSDVYATLYFDQYVLRGFVVFLLSFAVLYAVLDSVFKEFSVARKYLVTLVVAGGFFAYYYHPFLADPKYVYNTQDIADFRAVDEAVGKLRTSGVSQPTAKQVAQVVTLNAWKDDRPVGVLFPEDNEARISSMMPYLEGENYTLLVFKPLYKNVIFMDVLCIVFIVVFFGYQYKKDPPQGAYTEKILFLFLPLCSLDILHYFAYVNLQNYRLYLELFGIAQYLIVFNALLLLIFFSLRLSFITSIKGEFYERELVLDSEHISRWRDGIDNLVVRHFLNPKTIHGRLFAPREAKSKT